MGSPEGARQILAGLKEAGINLVASVPDINMLQLINLLYEDKEIAHVPVVAKKRASAFAPARIWPGSNRRC